MSLKKSRVHSLLDFIAETPLPFFFLHFNLETDQLKLAAFNFNWKYIVLTCLVFHNFWKGLLKNSWCALGPKNISDTFLCGGKPLSTLAARYLVIFKLFTF